MTRKYLPIFVVFLILLSLALVAPVHAQTPTTCARHADVIIHLSSNFGEVPVIEGTSNNGRQMMTFANIETGTWTMVIRVNETVSCLLATGTKFKALPAIGGRPT